MLATRRQAGRQSETERFAEPAPVELHGEVTSLHRFSIAAERIARGCRAVERAIDQIVQARCPFPGSEMRDEVRDQIARKLFVVVEAKIAARGGRIGLLR